MVEIQLSDMGQFIITYHLRAYFMGYKLNLGKTWRDFLKPNIHFSMRICISNHVMGCFLGSTSGRMDSSEKEA